MKQSVDKAGKCIGKIISRCLQFRIGLKFYNYIFERSFPKFTNFCVKYVALPNTNFVWTVCLLNKKKVKTQVLKDDKLTREFAVSYNWHSLGLKHIEAIVNNYYPQDVPWIDVGANMGLRSLYVLSQKKPVYFVEPNISLNKYNIQRCELNKFQNYKFLEFGASDMAGTVDFFIDHTSYCSTLEVNVLDEDRILQKKNIRVETLDKLFEDVLDLYKTACVKIDVEGHEIKVLKGAVNLITRLKPTMIIEVNEKGSHLFDLISITDQYDYSVFEIGYFTKGKFLRPVSLTANMSISSIRYNDFLFVQDVNLINTLGQYIIN